jgi:nicotinamide riboside transporter PnuC
MEPFVDGGLFELYAIVFVLLNGLNFIYRNKVFLLLFSLVSVGAVAFSFVQIHAPNHMVLRLVFLIGISGLNIYLWKRKLAKPKEVLFDIGALKARALKWIKTT